MQRGEGVTSTHRREGGRTGARAASGQLHLDQCHCAVPRQWSACDGQEGRCSQGARYLLQETGAIRNGCERTKQRGAQHAQQEASRRVQAQQSPCGKSSIWMRDQLTQPMQHAPARLAKARCHRGIEALTTRRHSKGTGAADRRR